MSTKPGRIKRSFEIVEYIVNDPQSPAHADSLRQQLERCRVARRRQPRARAPRRAQALAGEALARTYADVAAQPRFKAAGFLPRRSLRPKDFSGRDQAMLRISGDDEILPAKAVETAALRSSWRRLGSARPAPRGRLARRPDRRGRLWKAYRETSTGRSASTRSSSSTPSATGSMRS